MFAMERIIIQSVNSVTGAALWRGVLVVLFLVTAAGFSYEKEKIYPDGTPGAEGTGEAHEPTIEIVPALPEKANGCAIVILPGGVYYKVETGKEGTVIGDWFSQHGISSFVVRYRVKPYRHPVPGNDARRALRYVRFHAERFGIDPDRVGLMGFSAGGHNASYVGTHWDEGDESAGDLIERQSCGPDFLLLVYPVISMLDGYANEGSRRNLLGDEITQEKKEEMSCELHVTERTPPTFITHGTDDISVPIEGSRRFVAACEDNGVPVEYYEAEGQGHGYHRDSVYKAKARDWIIEMGFTGTVRATPRAVHALQGRAAAYGWRSSILLNRSATRTACFLLTSPSGSADILGRSVLSPRYNPLQVPD